MSDEASITVAEAREIVSDAAVWPRLRDLLWNFAPQIHPSWMEGLAIPVAQLMPSPRGRRVLLDTLGVEPCFHAFPRNDFSRLLLLDGEMLERLVKWLGALAVAGSIRRATNGEAVRAIKAALPGVYPEVFGYTMYFKELAGCGSATGDGTDPVADAKGAAALGGGMVFAMMADLSAPLAARLRLKLPKSIGEPAARSDVKVPLAALRASVARLLKLKFPEAYSLCC